MGYTVLLVEDDPSLRETLAYRLRRQGYHVLVAPDGLTALEVLHTAQMDLLVLDLMLPGIDGLEVCKEARTFPATKQIPIVILTARIEEHDKILGLDLGADDYITKPFSWHELHARIRSQFRRVAQSDATVGLADEWQGSLETDDVRLDLDRREVWCRGHPVEMAARLFDILAFFMRHRGIVLTRARLLEQVWGYDYGGDTRTVDVHIRWLREKIELDPANPQLILTVRGVGYRFRS